MRYCGMDVSDLSSNICISDERGKIFAEKVVMNDSDGIRQFFGKEEGMVVGLEACGISAWLAKEIEKYGHKVHVMDPRSIEAMTKGRKTDRIDARLLVQVLRGEWYREVHQKSEASRQIRSMVMARSSLVQIETKLAVQIQGLMKHWGLRVGSSNKAAFYDRILVGLERIPDLGVIIKPLMEGLVAIRKQLKIVDGLLREASNKNSKALLLMTVPGVGPVVAMAYLATIDDAKRFKVSRQVGAYLGLAARVYQSGETKRYGRITKHGDEVLRGYLLMAANSVLSKGKHWTKLKAWGLRLSKKKGYSKAKVAVARKLSVIMHRMLIDGRPFDYALA